MEKNVLSIRGLKTKFFTRRGVVNALDGVNLDVLEGEILGIVGETGCGKTVLALSVLGLLRYPGRVVEGSVVFRGRDLIQLQPDEIIKIRGSGIAMVFQDPLTFLNPVFTVGDQISEVFLFHADMNRKVLDYKIAKEDEKLANSPELAEKDRIRREISLLEKARESPPKAGSREAKKAAWYFSTEMLRLVKISDPERVAKAYPHELSGGMRQRVMIAMALALEPDILIADEATTALDVTTQAQILGLIKELRTRIGSAILIITHDLGIVAQMCERVAVMYAGAIVEVASTKDLFANPKHPYTQGLLASVPRMRGPEVDLQWIPGSVPDMINLPSGCRFHTRCPFAEELCEKESPEMLEVSESHLVSCHLYGKLRKGQEIKND